MGVGSYLRELYRFCRSDEIGLLVDALNRCWAPYFPDEPPMTPATFKRSIRDLQVWCSSSIQSLCAQRYHRIHAGRAACGDDAGDDRRE